MRRFAMTTLALLSLAAAPGPSGAGVLPAPPRVESLGNGLTVVLVPWDSPGIVAYQTTVRVGSRDEVDPGHSGYAHLCEHLLFRGTERYPKEMYEREIQLAGADNNAWTWLDLTNYFLLVPRDSLAKIIDIEADRFQRLKYDESAYRTETGAVHGEYLKNASSPSQLMEEALHETAFTSHPYGHTTMGHLADVEQMPEEYAYMQGFFARHYTPDNTVITVVGDFDAEQVLALVREHYGEWQGERAQPVVPTEPPQSGPRQRHVDWATETPPRITMAYKIPAFDPAAADSAALDVIHELSFGPSSPLYRRLVLEEKLLLSLHSPGGLYAPITRDPFLFLVEGVLAEGARFEQVEAAVTDELGRLALGEIDEGRLADVRSHLRYGFATGLETPEDVAMSLAMFIATTGSVGGLDTYAAQLAQVKAEDVRQVAERYLVPEGRTIVTLSHDKQGGAR